MKRRHTSRKTRGNLKRRLRSWKGWAIRTLKPGPVRAEILGFLLLLVAVLTAFGLSHISSGTVLDWWAGVLCQWLGWGAYLALVGLAGAGLRLVWSDLRDGLRYVWGWPGLMGIIGMAMILNFVMNPAFTLMPLLVTDHFQVDALALGALESGWGIGLVLGGLVLTAWGGFKRKVYTSLGALVVEGLTLAVVGLAPAGALWLAVAALFVSGVMNALVNGPFIALLQALVEPERHGRVFTLVSSLCSAAWPLSLVVAGPLADAFGVRPWFGVGGILSSLVAAVAFFVRPIVNVEENAHAVRPVLGEAVAAGARGDAAS